MYGQDFAIADRSLTLRDQEVFFTFFPDPRANPTRWTAVASGRAAGAAGRMQEANTLLS